jgi:hypothetical protein
MFLIVTQDEDFASRSDRIIHLEDSQITGNKRDQQVESIDKIKEVKAN